MLGLSLDISGVPQIQKAIKKIEENATKGVENELKASVLTIQRDAKRLAPKNTGHGAQNIATSGSGLTWDTFATDLYMAYQEFGTGRKVKIPAGYESFAAQYRGGKHGTFKEMIKAIMLWVRRKGISGTYSVKTQRRTGSRAAQSRQDQQAAYAIAISILRNGIKAQPFMIPAYEKEKPKLLGRLKKLFR